MSNTSQLDSILSRLGEHNVSDKEIDELVAKILKMQLFKTN